MKKFFILFAIVMIAVAVCYGQDANKFYAGTLFGPVSGSFVSSEGGTITTAAFRDDFVIGWKVSEGPNTLILGASPSIIMASGAGVLVISGSVGITALVYGQAFLLGLNVPLFGYSWTTTDTTGYGAGFSIFNSQTFEIIFGPWFNCKIGNDNGRATFGLRFAVNRESGTTSFSYGLVAGFSTF